VIAVSTITIVPGFEIDERDIAESFVHASGPGGQNVNKLSTAVELRFDALNSVNLTPDMRTRLKRLAGRRLSKQGVLIISAQRYRTQGRNREDARARLIELLRRAAVAPVARRPTRPTAAAAKRRLESKKRRSGVKRLRHISPEHD
jgi:ribosome-associated protein